MAHQLYPSGKWVNFGDSMSGWFTSGFQATANAAYTTLGSPSVVGPTVPTMIVTPAIPSLVKGASGAPANFAPTYFDAGVAGNTIAMLQARVASDVLARVPLPTDVFINCGINDLIAVTTPAAMEAAAIALLNTLSAGGIPAARVTWFGIWCYGEEYPDATWGVSVDLRNTALQAACVNRGANFLDVRPTQQAYEAIHNIPPPGVVSGITTVDGIHWNAAGLSLITSLVLDNVIFNGRVSGM